MLETVADMMIDSDINDRPEAPDLIQGIGLLQPRQQNHIPQRETPARLPREPRPRLLTVTGNVTPAMVVRRRWRTRSLRNLTPDRESGQLRITDIFKKQRNEDEKCDQTQ